MWYSLVVIIVIAIIKVKQLVPPSTVVGDRSQTVLTTTDLVLIETYWHTHSTSLVSLTHHQEQDRLLTQNKGIVLNSWYGTRPHRKPQGLGDLPPVFEKVPFLNDG